MTPRICLNMIVRNEAPIIERCLTSLLPHIGCWAITDTGSTDDTIEIIQRVFAGIIPGVLTQHPFENFAQARNAALDAARGLEHPQWSLLLADADMELVVTDPEWKTRITGHHSLLQRNSHLTYRNTRIIPANSTGRYIGTTHEFFSCSVAGSDCYATPLDGVHFVDHADGGNRPDKFARDIALLTNAYNADPHNQRTVFYLAQSHKDNGDLVQAEHWYAARIRMRGWDEEVWHSMLQLARLAETQTERHDTDHAKAITAYLQAHQFRPTRAEALTALARLHRERNEHHLALIFASQAIRIPYPATDRLFIDHTVYQWRALDEYALACHATGHKPQAAAAWTRLLGSNSLPDQQRQRILTNLGHALQGATR